MEIFNELHESIERPVQVVRSVQLLFASFGLGLVAATIAVIQQFSSPAIFVALIPVALFFGLALFLVSKISAGRNWARVTFLVIVLLGVPFAIPTYAEEFRRNVLSGGLSIFIAALQLFGTALLFTKNSNIWFKSHQGAIDGALVS
jgi:hypothetical protein